MKSVRYSVKNSISAVIVCASTFKGAKQLTYSHKAVLFLLKLLNACMKHEITNIKCYEFFFAIDGVIDNG